MNFTYCNVTAEDGNVDAEEPLAGVNMRFHDLALLICAVLAIFAVIVSVFHMFMHATHYSEPLEQRYIIRILFMVPIYAVVSWLSIAMWQHSVYFEVLRDCYEAFAIASFFQLMCHFVAPTLHDQKNYFRAVIPKPWVWPVRWCGFSFFKTPRSGLTWFNVIWFCVFQYCVVRVACTILAVVTEFFGRYCITSESPLFAHVWVSVIEAVAVTVAMVCLIQFYVQMKEPLAPHEPLWKLAAIKLVIFLCFWQTFLLSILTSQTTGVVKPGPHVAQPDLTVGIPALLVCIEMALFAIMHIFVYSWRPYTIKHAAKNPNLEALGIQRTAYHGGFLGIRAFGDAFNPMDLLRAIGRGFRWVFVGRKTREQDISYQHHKSASPTTLGEGGALGSLSSFKPSTGAGGKYSRLDDQGDESSIPLQSQAAPLGHMESGTTEAGFLRTPTDPVKFHRADFTHPDNPFADNPGTPDISRTPSPYEAYRQHRQRSQSQSQGTTDNLSVSAAQPPLPPAHADSFEQARIVPPTAPTPTPMHPTHGRLPYPQDPRHEALSAQDTTYHSGRPGVGHDALDGDEEDPWDSSRP